MTALMFGLVFLAGVAVGLGVGRVICEKVCKRGRRR